MKENKFMKSSNPFMARATKQMDYTGSIINDYQDKMTIDGALNKTFILFSILIVTTAISYLMPTSFLMWTGIIGGLAAVVFAMFKPEKSAIAAPVYAAFEGLFIGAISYTYAVAYEGIVFQAVGLTFGTLLTMLFIYKAGIVKVTQKLRAGVMMATGAVLMVYLMSWIMSMFGASMTVLHDNGLIGIGISVVIIGVAAFNLLLDFDNFEKGQENGAPQYMEWFYAMGLLITLVWLYIEFLRLLSKLKD